MEIPTYDESKAAAHNGVATPLQKFVYEMTPQFYEQTFRDMLSSIVDEVEAAAYERAAERVETYASDPYNGLSADELVDRDDMMARDIRAMKPQAASQKATPPNES